MFNFGMLPATLFFGSSTILLGLVLLQRIHQEAPPSRLQQRLFYFGWLLVLVSGGLLAYTMSQVFAF